MRLSELDYISNKNICVVPSINNENINADFKEIKQMETREQSQIDTDEMNDEVTKLP